MDDKAPTHDSKNPHAKVLSQPFKGTLQCFQSLTRDLFLLGCITCLTFVCERYPFFEHSLKHYDRDMFMFICLIFFFVAWWTRAPTKDLTLLSRDQTEEWKGWMQFIFLMYHYFHAEEVYNSVRVMITCYVWMTGFGNFSFFYFKQDFGWLRVVQMLWRLNFSVLFLMLWHGNTYILYYICPLHTFYFLMTYVIMAVGQHYNHRKWHVRGKIFAAIVVIYLIWDANSDPEGTVFDTLFWWLGTTPTVGAGLGSVWEWYFRSSLDKYSAIFGMIFACNYPLCEKFFVDALKKDRKPLIITAVVLGALGLWWITSIYTLEKLEYNLVHNYFAFIPLLVYIFFRNITPSVRSNISMSLHALGKTTLETYLLQHHIWLTSNAKTLLTIIPGNPVLNFTAASVLFVVLAKELYRLTMSLRGMMLPDDKALTIQNLKYMGIVVGVLTLQGGLLYVMSLRFGGSLVMIAGTFYGLMELLQRRGPKEVISLPKFETCYKYTKHAAAGLAALGLIFILCGSDSVEVRSTFLTQECKSACLKHVSEGKWSLDSCEERLSTRTLLVDASMDASSAVETQDARRLDSSLDGFQMDGYSNDALRWDYMEQEERRRLDMYSVSSGMAHCEMRIWSWKDVTGKVAGDCGCPGGLLSRAELKTLLAHKRIMFVGDSNTRSAFHAMADETIDNYNFEEQSISKSHSDLAKEIPGIDTTIEYKWAPFISNITQTLGQIKSLRPMPDVLALGAGLWDVLHVHDLEKTRKEIEKMNKALHSLMNPTNGVKYTPPMTVWIPPLTIINSELRAPDKIKYMTEEQVAEFRKMTDESELSATVSLTINSERVSGAYLGIGDGVHYQAGVYHVLSQLIANGMKVVLPPPPSPPVKSKPTGSMSFPLSGFAMVVMAAVMLFTMDSFFGIGYAALRIFGLKLDWALAYAPIMEQLGKEMDPADRGDGEGASPQSVEMSQTPDEDDGKDSEPLLRDSSGPRRNEEMREVKL